MASDLDALRTIYALKQVQRRTKTGDRKESSAEHTFSCIALAKLFLPRISPALNERKVHDLLLIHDWVEIHAGDTFFLDHEHRLTQAEREIVAAKKLIHELPSEIAAEYAGLHEEFEAQETREARFAKAIDALDPMVQAVDTPTEWSTHGFTEEILREKKLPMLHDFPPLIELFEEIVNHLRRTGAF